MDNFYIANEKYYVVIDCQNVEVCEVVYDEYKKSEYSIGYSDKKYNRWNASLDNDTLVSAKYEYIALQKQHSLEDEIIADETAAEVFKKLSPVDRLILERLIDGFTETEIAQEIGFTQQKVNRHKQKIRRMF